MREHRYRLGRFAFYDRARMEAYLERQAAKGWLLDQIHAPIWRFRRIEPKKVHFSITYFPGAVEFDPLPNHRQGLYQEFCAHAGWQLAASSAQLQIFYNEQEDPVPIETDPVVELENIHKAMKKRVLPIGAFLLGLCIFMLITQLRSMDEELIITLGNDLLLAIPVFLLAMAVLIAAELAGYFRWYHRALKYARQSGELLPTGSGIAGMLVFWVLMLFLLAAVWRSGGMDAVVIVLATFAGYELLYLIVQAFRTFLLRKEVSYSVNLAATLVAAVVLFATVGNIGTILATHAIDAIFPQKEEPKLFIYNNMRLELYDADIPMTMTDLGMTLETPMELATTYESVLLSRTVCMEGTMEERFEEALFYNVIDVKYDWLMEPVLEDLNDPEKIYNQRMVFGWFFYSLQVMEPAPWGADEAWQGLDSDGQPLAVYLLRYGNRIVALSLDEELTAAQMEKVGEIFE